MGLSCDCDMGDGDSWSYTQPEDYSVLSTRRRKRCCSCKILIGVGDTVVKFERTQPLAYDSIAAKIYGDDYPLAPWYMCESCGDLYFSLDELGFCIYIDQESMPQLLKQYHEIYRL